MNNLASHKTTKDIVSKYGFRFTKSLGQNFLVDEDVLEKIVDGAEITSEDTVIEIGPGIGTLTRQIAQRAKQTVAIEIDKKLIPILSETLGDMENVRIINEDVLKVDLKELVKSISPDRPVKVVANLPYYITTPIIMRFLEENIPVSTMVIMIQKEVAARINAVPSTKDYGSLSVAVQYYCDTDIVAKVPKGAFIPQPNVESAVLRLTVKKDKELELKDEALFFEVVKASFSKRRKTLLNALSSFGTLGGKQEAIDALEAAGIDPQRRGETLTMDEFAELSNRYYEILLNLREQKKSDL